MNFLYSIDVFVFQLINQRWTAEWLDHFFIFITLAHKNSVVKFGIIPALLAFVVFKDRWRGAKVIVCLALTIAVSDNFAHRVLKPYFQRQRPQMVVEETKANLRLGYSPSGYSFPSNHATNNFAGATLLTCAYPALGGLFYLYAFLVAYSRPYVGVHYPSDIVAGGLLGMFIAWALYRFVFRKFLRRKKLQQIQDGEL